MEGIAQQIPHRVSLDVGSGMYSGRGAGDRVQRTGLSVATQVTGKMIVRNSSSLLAGLNFSVFANLPSEDCLIRLDANNQPTTTGCVPGYPVGNVFSALAGGEQKFGKTAAVRAFAGPALFRPYHSHGEYGTFVRVDASFPAHSHGAFVVWTESAWLPVENSPHANPILVGLGFRLR